MRMDRCHDTPGASTGSELVPWAATAEPRRSTGAAPRRRIADGVARAALVIAGLGVGAAAASFALSSRPAVDGAAAPQGTHGPRPADLESLEHRVADALGALKSEVADLRADVAHDQDAARARDVTRRLDELGAHLDTVKAETSGSLAQLAAKIDPLRQETAARLQAMVERLDRLEHRGEAATAAKPPEPPAAARTATDPGEAARRPPVIRGWVVRDVHDGIALVEGADGPIEVMPGALLPGAGRVRSIERSGRGWIVVTSRGVIDSARGRF
jgi:hypothetical protein